MCNRTRKLKVSFNDYDEKIVLANLGQLIDLTKNEIKTLELDVPDTKKTYEYLVQAREVLDWEFLDDEGEIPEKEEKSEVVKKSTNLKSWEDERAEIVEILKKEYFSKNLITSPEILTLIKTILGIKQVSPALRFSPKFILGIKAKYDERLKEKFDQGEIPLLYFLDGYNSITTGSILEELIENIHRIWNTVESAGWTTLQFVEAIYDIHLGTEPMKLG